MSGLFTSRRFWPLFGAQSLGAFADNALRNATIVAVPIAAGSGQAFAIPFGLGEYAGAIVSVAFTLPVLVFSMIAGQLADKVDRDILIRRLKIIELGLMAFASLCFALGNGPLLIFSLFLMGTQSAFFSPVRTAVMPDYYTREELPKANGYFNAALFVALVSGLALGGFFIGQDGGRVVVASLLVTAAALGAAFAFFTPKAPAPGAAKINWNVPVMAVRLFKQAAAAPGVLYPLLGIGWFWMINAALLAVVPNVVRQTLNAGGTELALIMVMAATGAGVGSIASGLLASRVKDAFTLAGLGVAGTVIAALVTFGLLVVWETPEAGFFSAGSVPLFLAIGGFAAANGLFVVPMMAALQARAPDALRAQIMGTSNMANGGLATLGALLVPPIIVIGLPPEALFLLVAALQGALLAFMWRRQVAIRAAGAAASENTT